MQGLRVIQGKNPKAVCRKPTARFEFKMAIQSDCPIMHQHTVLNIVLCTPRCPGPRPDILTPAWKSAASLFAYHIMLLYKLWEGPSGIPPAEALTWKDDYIFILRKDALFLRQVKNLRKWSNVLRKYCVSMFTPENSLLRRSIPLLPGPPSDSALRVLSRFSRRFDQIFFGEALNLSRCTIFGISFYITIKTAFSFLTLNKFT